MSIKPVNQFNIGDSVLVSLPCGQMPGKVRKIFPDYGWVGDPRYEIHGENLRTICSARMLKADNN
jgi:hypothetical protein